MRVALERQYLPYSDRTLGKLLLSGCMKPCSNLGIFRKEERFRSDPFCHSNFLSCFHFFSPAQPLIALLFSCWQPCTSTQQVGALCALKKEREKKRVKTLVWHTKSMHESIKMNASGAFWRKGERRMASEEEDKSERWHMLKRWKTDAERGGEGGKGEKRGRECSFKWKLAL